MKDNLPQTEYQQNNQSIQFYPFTPPPKKKQQKNKKKTNKQTKQTNKQTTNNKQKKKIHSQFGSSKACHVCLDLRLFSYYWPKAPYLI